LKQKIFIAGHQGLVGSSIYNFLKKKNKKLIIVPKKNLDLTEQNSVRKWFEKNQPDIVINAAGKVGGILDNKNFQSDYLYNNTMIGLNLINSSIKYGVK